MLEELLKYLAVFGSSMFKFVLGPALGKKFEFSFILTALLTSGGMMASVYLFSSVLGKRIHCWTMKIFFRQKKLFSRTNRRKIKIWRNYGLLGIAFLTPILFTPIGGTLIATSFGEHRGKIFRYMLASAVFWGFLFSFLISIVDFQKIILTFK